MPRRKDRCEVHSITGYPINPSAWSTAGNQKPRTTYWVADTLYGYSEAPMIVADGRAGVKNHKASVRTTDVRGVAESNCARLNAEDRADA